VFLELHDEVCTLQQTPPRGHCTALPDPAARGPQQRSEAGSPDFRKIDGVMYKAYLKTTGRR
jgi:hypothetical protein